ALALGMRRGVIHRDVLAGGVADLHDLFRSMGVHVGYVASPMPSLIGRRDVASSRGLSASCCFCVTPASRPRTPRSVRRCPRGHSLYAVSFLVSVGCAATRKRCDALKRKRRPVGRRSWTQTFSSSPHS